MKHSILALVFASFPALTFANSLRISEGTMAANDAKVASVAWNIAAGICRSGMNNSEFNTWAEKRGSSEYISSQKNHASKFAEACKERLEVCLPGLVVSVLNPFNLLTPQPWNAKPAWCESAFSKAIATNKGIDCINTLAAQIAKKLDEKNYPNARSVVSTESNCVDHNIAEIALDKSIDADLFKSKGGDANMLIQGLADGRFKLILSTGNYDRSQDTFTIPGNSAGFLE